MGNRIGAALALALSAAIAFGGCAAAGDPGARPTTSGRAELTVSAAASLADVLDALLTEYGEVEPEVTITPNFGGSAQLVQQALAGAPVDVLIAADESAPDPLLDADLIEGEARVMASNALVLVVPASNPAGIAAVGDLAAPGVRVSVCAVQVPCGRSAAEALAAADVELAAPSEENDVRAVLSKVSTGEVDAGFVYRTDAVAAGAAVEVVPSGPPVANRYPVLVLRDSGNIDSGNIAAARAFQDWLCEPDAQAILADAGFGASE